ncbi:hypothetical protein [Dokdonella sp.]|uniref:hypothetical protein n=1 Tax=Dokdonella sp. TaxID=2291710 RepID=UPI003528A2AD
MSPKVPYILIPALVFFFTIGSVAWAAPGGTAIVRVTTNPAYPDARLGFTGTPSGDVQLDQSGVATIRSEVDSGSHESILARIDQNLLDAGYRLTQVSCDDPASTRRSSGDLESSKARFEVEDDETVTCTFALQPSFACTCPKQGRWNVVNNTGSMACTGVVSMTTPLAASRSSGTLSVNDSCDTILAEGMSDDEADLEMRLQSDCSWLGTVGGEQDGIPMVITFRWNLENEERILGDLESTVSQQGMTCRMSRTFSLDFAN